MTNLFASWCIVSLVFTLSLAQLQHRLYLRELRRDSGENSAVPSFWALVRGVTEHKLHIKPPTVRLFSVP